MKHRALNAALLFTLALFAALAWGVASAQAVELPTGIPAEYQAVATALIGLLSAVLVGPLTSIAKKLGGTTGPTTVVVSGVLSLIVAFAFTAAQAAAGAGEAGLWSTLAVALIAFLKSNGDYLSRMFSTRKAVEEAAPEVPAATLPLNKDAPYSGGLEPMPLMDWEAGLSDSDKEDIAGRVVSRIRADVGGRHE